MNVRALRHPSSLLDRMPQRRKGRPSGRPFAFAITLRCWVWDDPVLPSLAQPCMVGEWLCASRGAEKAGLMLPGGIPRGSGDEAAQIAQDGPNASKNGFHQKENQESAPPARHAKQPADQEGHRH